MQQRSARRAGRDPKRLGRAIRSCAEPLESRLLLSTYTVTNTNDSGLGSLRDAIQNSLATTIFVHASGTITLSSQIEISRSLTIDGPGANVVAVSGGNAVRVFQVDAGATAEIDGLTITDGHAPDGSPGAAATTPAAMGGNGTAGANGGAILSSGTLTLAHDVISDSRAGSGGAGGKGGPFLFSPPSSGIAGPGGNAGNGGDGGAIYSTGPLRLDTDVLLGNHAGMGGAGGDAGNSINPVSGGTGGVGGSGGGIYSTSAVTISATLLQGNAAGAGGPGGNGSATPPPLATIAPGGSGGSGGAIYVSSSGTTTSSQNTFTSDSAGDGPALAAAGGNGGAISSVGAVTSSDDIFTGCFAGGGDGAAGGSGGAIYCLANLKMGKDIISSNRAGSGAGRGDGGSGGSGGGIYSGGSGDVADTTIDHNSAGSGTAAYTVVGNGGAGGGIYSVGPLTLTNDTLTANSAGAGGTGLAPNSSGGSGGSGGGVFAQGTARLTNDTIIGNSAGAGASGATQNGANGTGAGIFVVSGLTLGNTIIATDSAPGAGPDISASGGFVSEGHNFIGVIGGSGWQSSDQTGTTAQPLHPKLAPLANYGGPLPIMPPLPGSPVIGGGDPALITNPAFSGPPFTDEQGQPRLTQLPDGSSRVDIGAVQFKPIPLVVTTTADGGDTPGGMTLRSAVALADLIPGDHTITFNIPTTDPGYDAASGAYTIALGSGGGPLELSDTPGSTTIEGPGAGSLIISGGTLASVLEVDSGVTVQLDGVTLTGGAEGIVNNGTLGISHCTVSGAAGTAGVMNNGTMTLAQAAISQNSGSGVVNAGMLTVTGSTISNNANGGVSNSSTLAVMQSTISGNMQAGGISNAGTLTLTASTLSGNQSDRYGGAVGSSGTATINDCTIAENSADLGGGGVSVSAGTMTLTNDTITANTVNGSGGGVEVLAGNLSLYDTIVAGNTDAFPAPDDIDGTVDAHLATGQPPSSNNLIGTGGSGGLTNGTNGNMVGVADPKLGPLADDGGPTQTIALLASSPAIDHGSNALANAAGLTTDQRGYGRIYNRVVDIGAFEYGSAIPGDLNHDGAVNFADLLALAQNYGSSNATWEQGDLNGDGSVNFADLLILAQNYGRQASAGPAAGESLLDVVLRRRRVRF